MRLAHAGIRPRAPLRDFTFDGRPISGYADETIAACLVANGIRAFRTDRAGAPRGMYCGMGVCFECLVRVDGRENVRACMTALGDAGRIETQDVPGRGPAMTAAAPELASAPPVEEPELLIVGVGDPRDFRPPEPRRSPAAMSRCSTSGRISAGSTSSSSLHRMNSRCRPRWIDSSWPAATSSTRFAASA